MSDCNHNHCHPCPPPPGSLPPVGCPPIAPIPPINIPPCGDTSTWGAISRLNERVNNCIAQTNGVIAKAEQAIACIQKAACENGAYYGPNEVFVEEGYDSDASSKYFVIRKKPVDASGCPIRMQLKLAYDNTTNSLLAQDAFEASQMEAAQFMVPAVPVDPNVGWFGHAIWQGAPIPSTTLTNAYTAGFTKSGRLKWYDNSVDIAQLKRDQIENAMGVYGILVAGGDITDSALRAQIPNADQRRARVCIGQNYDTQETFILTCGDVDTNGMTSLGCAAVLKQYGCDVAVECCQGPTSCALDKGQMLYIPDDHRVPAAYAYWYVTKKDTYRTQFVRELADLAQKYGQAIWAASLTYGSITDITDDITRLSTQVGQNTTDISALKAGNSQSSATIANLKTTVELMDARVTTLENTVAQIVSDTGSVGSQLQIINNQITTLTSNLQQEIADRKSAFNNLQSALNTEISNRSNGDAAIRTALDALTATVTTNKADSDAEMITIKNTLADAQTNINDHRTKIEALRSDLTALQSTVASNYNTLNELVAAHTTQIGNHSTQIASLLESMTTLDTAVSNYIIELADIEEALNNIKEVNTTILTQNADLLEKYNNLPADLTEFTDRMSALEARTTAAETKINTNINNISKNAQDIYAIQHAGGWDNYYFDAVNGSDDGDGSIDRPFKTPAPVYHLISTFAQKLLKLAFAPGTYTFNKTLYPLTVCHILSYDPSTRTEYVISETNEAITPPSPRTTPPVTLNFPNEAIQTSYPLVVANVSVNGAIHASANLTLINAFCNDANGNECLTTLNNANVTDLYFTGIAHLRGNTTATITSASGILILSPYAKPTVTITPGIHLFIAEQTPYE